MEAQEIPHALIGADRVEGTAVYNASGDRLGDIHDVMIDKVSGRVAYAVLSFGGFLGLGEKYHPLPWNALKYDTDRGGYVVNLSKEQLEGGPSYEDEDDVRWDDRDYEKKLHDYYGLPPYWMV